MKIIFPFFLAIDFGRFIFGIVTLRNVWWSVTLNFHQHLLLMRISLDYSKNSFDTSNNHRTLPANVMLINYWVLCAHLQFSQLGTSFRLKWPYFCHKWKIQSTCCKYSTFMCALKCQYWLSSNGLKNWGDKSIFFRKTSWISKIFIDLKSESVRYAIKNLASSPPEFLSWPSTAANFTAFDELYFMCHYKAMLFAAKWGAHSLKSFIFSGAFIRLLVCLKRLKKFFLFH